MISPEELKTYLSGNVGKRRSHYLGHTVNASVAQPRCFGIFLNRAWRGEYVFEGLKVVCFNKINSIDKQKWPLVTSHGYFAILELLTHPATLEWTKILEPQYELTQVRSS
jgi:hypothetical protein